MVISRSREDARRLEGKLKFGDDTLALKDSVTILGMEVDSQLSFARYLEGVARKASLRVTLLRQVQHFLNADGLLKLYKAHGVLSPHMDEQRPVPPLSAGQSTKPGRTLNTRCQQLAEATAWAATTTSSSPAAAAMLSKAARQSRAPQESWCPDSATQGTVAAHTTPRSTSGPMAEVSAHYKSGSD
ncbi:uncharacterized protein LOC123518872 [Portunus trituberculatus]|uniref:uncharacterized protein LOC123518872 n=1 Tax=Portunus trituberculatus TaxID=210409 RepID=UPI001E1CCB4A|nr:uncharacterized protein LOC123518872 [Portunus trituberculatus]